MIQARNCCLTSILHKYKDELRLFGHSAEQMGFVDRLNQLFTEMKRYCVTAEQLEEHENRRVANARRTVVCCVIKCMIFGWSIGNLNLSLPVSIWTARII